MDRSWRDLTYTDFKDMAEFQDKIKTFVMDKCNNTISEELFNRMFTFAWDQGHSAGYHEVCLFMDEIYHVVTGFDLSD